jgi:Co/Zn/Cd efflux system component
MAKQRLRLAFFLTLIILAVEVIGGYLANSLALTLILVPLWILWEAFGRLQQPEKVAPLVMFLSAGIGIGVNLFIWRLF